MGPVLGYRISWGEQTWKGLKSKLWHKRKWKRPVFKMFLLKKIFFYTVSPYTHPPGNEFTVKIKQR